MQAPTTMTRGKGINPLTAGAIALALLAVATIGLATLGNDIELPLIGGESKVESVTTADPLAEMLLIEQNSFDYAAIEPIDPFVLEENSWDYQPATDDATVAGILFFEQNSFDYVTPMTVQDVRFAEENSWDWDRRAQIAGGESDPAAAPDYRFMEENSWDTDHLVYPEESGSSDY